MSFCLFVRSFVLKLFIELFDAYPNNAKKNNISSSCAILMNCVKKLKL